MKNLAIKIPGILFLLTLLVSQSALASPDEDHKRPDIDALATQLDLDEGKAGQLKAMMEQHRDQMKDMRQQGKKSRQQMHEMRDQHREQLLTVLNHEQLYELERYMRQFRGHGHRKGKKDRKYEDND